MFRSLREWLRHRIQQLFERPEVQPLDGGIQRRFDHVIARYVRRIDSPHGLPPRLRIAWLLREALPPFQRPGVIGAWVGELRSDTVVAFRARCIAKTTECQGKVGGTISHPLQEILDQIGIFIPRACEADLGAHPIKICRFKARPEDSQCLLGYLDCGLRFRCQQW